MPAEAGIQNSGGWAQGGLLDSGLPPKGTSYGVRRNDDSTEEEQ